MCEQGLARRASTHEGSGTSITHALARARGACEMTRVNAASTREGSGTSITRTRKCVWNDSRNVASTRESLNIVSRVTRTRRARVLSCK